MDSIGFDANSMCWSNAMIRLKRDIWPRTDFKQSTAEDA